MKVRPFRLTIKPQIDDYSASDTSLEYIAHFEQLVDKALAETHFEDKRDFLAWTNDALPLVRWSDEEMSSDSLRLFIFCRNQQEALSEESIYFFIKQRIFHGEGALPINFRYLPFRFEEIPSASFLAYDLHFFHINGRLRHQIKSNLPRLAQDIALALRAPAFAKYAPQTGTQFNQKNAAIYEQLIPIQRRLPQHFDNSLLNDFTRLLWLSSADFIAEREPLHITRLICSHSIIYKQLARLF
ncbi:MAG: hypothetical protein JSR46_08790, partial [Verrucomicrobia bacterium]|nr:hypothetical protein [Verrucomicrobiota bacterium]